MGGNRVCAAGGRPCDVTVRPVRVIMEYCLFCAALLRPEMDPNIPNPNDHRGIRMVRDQSSDARVSIDDSIYPVNLKPQQMMLYFI